MNETTTTHLPAIAAITPAQAKTKLSLALTNAEFILNVMQKQASEIVVNEDHLEVTKSLLDKFVKARSLVDAAHKKEKEPYLQGGKAIDAAKNETLAQIAAIEDPLRAKYNKVCSDVAQRQREQQEEMNREKAILDGIESNVMEFSQRIAQCTTNDELLAVERIINRQKAGDMVSKYGKHHAFAIERFDTVLLPILRDQKTKIKDLAALDKQIEIAAEDGDIDRLESLTIKKENVEQEIQHNQAKVQDNAIMSGGLAAPAHEVIETTIPKGGRTEYECEIVDLNVALKKSPQLLNIELKLSEAKKNAKLLDDAEMFKVNNIAVVNGIKYTKVKRY
jgi:hypothetical protein